MKSSSTNYSYIIRIVYSKLFRNLQDKTQLFYSVPKRQVRTRLTHTIEVKIIAHDIGRQINKKIGINLIDLNLVEAIALAHDIGHTPFGHIGERTIDDIVSKKDDLGGLLNPDIASQIRFKHNVNSMRILEELGIEDWRIIEGALCHTKIFYKDDKNTYSRNPYNPFIKKDSKTAAFLRKKYEKEINTSAKAKVHSLTLEGQIVSVADEIAQRIADISDGLESRYLEKIKGIFSTTEDLNTRLETERFIRETLIDDVVNNTTENIENQETIIKRINGISHTIYNQEVVCFSENMKSINDKLEKYIQNIMAQSESVRESDSRSRYIIRQLFKAYLNDITLLPDEFISDYFYKITKKTIFKNALSIIENLIKESKSAELNEIFSVLSEIKKEKWKIDKRDLPKNAIAFQFSLIKKYFKILIENHHTNNIPCLNELFDEYILKIGFYIASLTNTEAFTTYNRIYGH